MAQPRVRPTFDHPLCAGLERFQGDLVRALQAPGGRVRGQLFGHGAILRIRHDERRVWSPALHLHVEADPTTGREAVHGRFSPSSPVWTAFVAIYLALTCVFLASVSYGWAQLTLETTPWALWGAPVALALAAFTYGAAFVGQGLGAEDMYEMRAFVEHVARGEDPVAPCARPAASLGA